jgi:perosamine synthetase
MTDLQAALGVVQLAKLDAFIDERAQWAKWYSEELASLEWLRQPGEPEGGRHAWQAYVTVVEDDAPIGRNELMARLHERGVATRPGTHSVPSTGYYRRRPDVATDGYPVASRLQERSMAIPLHNRMTPDDYEHVAGAIRAAAGAR